MTRTGERDLSRIGGLDYALMTSGSCLAAFSGSMAVQMPNVGVLAVLAIVVGASVSYSVRVALLRSRFIRMDGLFYAMAIIAGWTFAPQIQELMPDGGYAQDVLPAAWLTSMLMLGSFFTWQDATILFQAVPAISLFALAGIYSTWNGVVFAFFAFMMCLATLVARAHRRAMLKQAADSGYFTRGMAPGSIAPSVETTPGLARTMDEGPWKWIAGPEWALASALAIVLVSLVGAPYIKLAVSPVSGFAKIVTPRSIDRKLQNQTFAASSPQESVTVGQGPNNLVATPEFEIKTDPRYVPFTRYLRTACYYQFANHTWSALSVPNDATGSRAGAATLASYYAIAPALRKDFAFQLRLRTPLKYMPYPGNVINWTPDAPKGLTSEYDGRIDLPPNSVGQVFDVRAGVADGTNPVSAEWEELPPIFDQAKYIDNVSPRVQKLVAEVIKGAKSDFDKAERIREKIASTIVYNIDAAAIPNGADPVDYTMFDHPEAYCDVYACAMTVMARQAKIPARFVVGYRPDANNIDNDGWNVVLESDRHAWAELYFKDYGWVIFDATDGARSVPGEGRGAANSQGAFFSRPWVSAVLNGLIGVGLAALLYLGFRLIRQTRAAVSPSADLARAYLRYSHIVERRMGGRRKSSLTPEEFLECARPYLKDAYPQAQKITERFVAGFYSPHSPTSSEIDLLRADIRNFARRLKEQPK